MPIRELALVTLPVRPEVPADRQTIHQTQPEDLPEEPNRDHPGPLVSNHPQPSASSGLRRSKAERNLLIQVRHHRPPEITLR